MVRAAEMAKDCNDPNFFVHHITYTGVKNLSGIWTYIRNGKVQV